MIQVSWARNEPPLKPKSWHKWSPAVRSLALERPDTDAGTEGLLGWPCGTLQILREAFQLKLSRHTGWWEPPEGTSVNCHVPEVPGARHGKASSRYRLTSPVEAAARVYKRGVAYGQSKETIQEPQTFQGRYKISVHSLAEAPLQSGDHLWTVVDAHVAQSWPQIFATRPCYVMTLTEHTKSLESVGAILKAWADCGHPRRWQIVGGGLLSDVAAFAAALVGAEFDLLPTTLLAMVDACVGGKTGVNFHPFGKNQVGAWAFPMEVRVWSPWLSSLPERELRAGAVEALKHAFLLGDFDLAKGLTTFIQTETTCNLEPLLEPLMRCKADIVERDPAEEGERAALNLGHTLGHGLEGYAMEASQEGRDLLHGEAVGFGLVYALLLSERVAGLSSQVCSRMISLVQEIAGCLSRTTLIHALGESDLTAHHVFERLQYFMGMDKKNIHGAEIRWVLLSSPGEVHRFGEAWTTPVPSADLREVWAQLIAILPEK